MTERHLTAQFDGPYDGDPFEAIAHAADEALWSDHLAAAFDDLDAEAFAAERETAL